MKLSKKLFIFVLLGLSTLTQASTSRGGLALLKGMGFQLVNSEPIEFSLPLVTGGEGKLVDYKGKWIFLTFWATWCGPCQYEMPSLQKISETFNKKSIQILGISIDEQGERKVRPFVEGRGIKFPIFLDQKSVVASKYQASSIPSIYVVSPDWKLVAVFRGAKDWSGPSITSSLEKLAEIKGIDESEWEEQKNSVARGSLASALTPPKMEIVIRKDRFQPGDRSSIECIVSWEGEAALYIFKTPKLTLPTGVEQKGTISSFSATDKHGARLVYTIPIHFLDKGQFKLGPVELAFNARMGGGEDQFIRSQTISVDVMRPHWMNPWLLGGGGLIVLISILVLIYINIVQKRDRSIENGVVSNESLRNELSEIQKLKIQASKNEYERALLRINLIHCDDESEKEKIEKLKEEISFAGRELNGDELRYYEKIFKKLDG